PSTDRTCWYASATVWQFVQPSLYASARFVGSMTEASFVTSTIWTAIAVAEQFVQLAYATAAFDAVTTSPFARTIATFTLNTACPSLVATASATLPPPAIACDGVCR